MLQLTIDRRQATMDSLNPRAEFAGEEKRIAIDVGLSMTFGGEVLDAFDPKLHGLLFDQQTLDLAGGAAIRYPKMAPLVWQDDMTGAKVAFDIGISTPVGFTDAKVNKFVLIPQEGGTVILKMRVQVYPTEDQIGKLAGHIQQGITFSLTPMELPVMQEERPSTSPTKRGKKITKAEADEQLKALAADGVTVALVSPDGAERVLSDGDALEAAAAAIAADTLDPAHPDALQAAHDAKVAATPAEEREASRAERNALHEGGAAANAALLAQGKADRAAAAKARV